MGGESPSVRSGGRFPMTGVRFGGSARCGPIAIQIQGPGSESGFRDRGLEADSPGGRAIGPIPAKSGNRAKRYDSTLRAIVSGDRFFGSFCGFRDCAMRPG